MKFENKGFSHTGDGGLSGWVDQTDNPFFESIQVKDITSIVTDDCEFWWDFDTAVFMAASVQDETKVKVTNKITGEETVYKNKTEFKGRLKKEGAISDTSKLGIINIKRSAEGKKPYKLSDFDVEDIRSLKNDGSLEKAKEKILDLISAVKNQFRIKPSHKIVYSLGSGSCFRSNLKLPELYKGSRDPNARPTLLNELRCWMVDEMGAVITEAKGTDKCLESDDICSIAGYEGYLNYLKTSKFSKVQIGYDKDDWQGCCLYLNYHLKGVKFKIPQAILIHNTQKGGVGTTELIEGECKSSGMLQICYQLCCGDSSDNYHPYLKFPKNMQPEGSYADVSFYKDFVGVKTTKDALQKVVDKYYEWFPFGLKYKDFKGDDVDIDTMSWLNIMFLCVYMKRAHNDNMDFYKLCVAMKVDTSKIVDNNNLTPPQRVFVGNESHINDLSSLIETILKDDMKGCKQLKSKEKDKVFDKIREKLESVDFESHYEMKQFEKENCK